MGFLNDLRVASKLAIIGVAAFIATVATGTRSRQREKKSRPCIRKTR